VEFTEKLVTHESRDKVGRLARLSKVRVKITFAIKGVNVQVVPAQRLLGAVGVPVSARLAADAQRETGSGLEAGRGLLRVADPPGGLHRGLRLREEPGV
jgi:hypothetical protein